MNLEGGYTKIVLGNGRTFYGYPSRERYVNIYNACHDVIPKGFCAETYQAAVDASFRYLNAGHYKFFPGPGGVVIEGGAFIGYKAVRFAELVGNTGRVIAIEIGKQNYELLCKNIAINGMSQVVTPVHCGIWTEHGERIAELKYANSYHLAIPDEHDWCNQTESVPTATLDEIIEQHGLGTVDFLNLQLNGSEYEGLLGLRRHLNDVKILRIAAYYTRDGVRQCDQILDLLRHSGCKILAVSRKGQIMAASPRFAHLFTPLQTEQDTLETIS